MTTRPFRGALLLATLAAFSAHARPPAKGHGPTLPALDGGGTEGARYLATLPSAVREALERDGLVLLPQPAGGSTMVRAVARFRRPRAEVFALVSQPAQQQTYVPHVETSKSLGDRTAEGERIDFVVSYVFSLKYRTQHWFYPEEGRVEWSLDPAGGDGLQEQEGYWQLYELDASTTVAEYGTHVAAKGSGLNFLRGLGERGGVEEALTAVRKHVDAARP